MEYFKHKAVWTMFSRNAQFYEETWQGEYDILRFARKMLRGRWCGESVVRFLAFGLCGYSKRNFKNLRKGASHMESSLRLAGPLLGSGRVTMSLLFFSPTQ